MRRVLVAEDDPDTAAAIRTTLEEHLQVAVDHVTNGALVLDQIAAMRPDVVILDVAMPGLNGLDVFDLLRGSGPHTDVPVLFLTAQPDRAEHAFATVGVSDVMGKPFDGEALARRVEMLLARSEKVA